MQEVAQFVSKNLNFSFLKIPFAGSSWKAFAIIALLFLLVLTLAQVRRHYIDWSFKGALFGVFFGFLLALFLEGFLIIGGRTAITELLGWKNAPKPVQTAIEMGRGKLIEVLGISNEVSETNAQTNPTSDDVITIMQSLDPAETKKVKSLICEP